MTADDGFENFYVSTRQRLVAFLYAVSGDLPDAQDVYARAWQRWSTLHTYGDPEAWLRTVGYRLLCNRWRRARNRRAAYRRHGTDQPTGAPSENTINLHARMRGCKPVNPDNRVTFKTERENFAGQQAILVSVGSDSGARDWYALLRQGNLIAQISFRSTPSEPEMVRIARQAAERLCAGTVC